MTHVLKRRCVRSLSSAVSAAALLTAACATAASAQDQDQDQDEEVRRGAASLFIEEIQISATKKTNAENLQSVPIAVTAYGEAQLDALKVRSLYDLSYGAPNVQLEDIGTTPGYANFSIRGLGINSSIPSIDPAVGVFIDGMYIGTNAGVVFDTFDLAGVEVLRGPQGVLFGRNVTGGAVVINTTDPTEELTGKFKVAAESGLRGTGANYFAMGRVSGAAIPDKLRVKLGVYYNNDDGWFENLSDGENIGAQETLIFRGAAQLLVSENVESTVRFEVGSVEGDGPVAQNRARFDRNTFDVAIDEPGLVDSEWWQAVWETNIDVAFGDGQITNIFSYRDTTAESISDIDALDDAGLVELVAPGALPFGFHSTSRTLQDQWSNELRYNGRFGDVDLTAGLYYFDQSLTYVEGRFIPASGDFSGGGVQDHETFGAFMSADINLSEKLILTLGGRYTYEKKEAQVATLPINLVASGGVVVLPVNPDNPCNVETNIEACGASPGGLVGGSESWDFFSPRINLQYQLNDDTQMYGGWSRGFRAGGFNLRRTLPLRPFGVINPERIDSFEVGIKHTTPDGKFRINAAAFYMDITNMQRELNLPDPLVGVGQDITNTANATIQGIEAEARWLVTDNFILTGTIGYLDGDYQQIFEDISFDPNAVDPTNPSTDPDTIDEADFALQIPRLASLTWGVGFIFDQDLGDGSVLSFRGNFNHRDQNAYTDNNAGFINAADILDASINYQFKDPRFQISLYGRNMLNEVTAGGDTQLPAASAIFQPVTGTGANPTFSPLNRGATYGIEFQVDI